MQSTISLRLTSTSALSSVPRDAIEVKGGTLTSIVPSGTLAGRQFDVTVAAAGGGSGSGAGAGAGGVNTVVVKANGFTLASGVLAAASNEITITVDNQGPQVRET